MNREFIIALLSGILGIFTLDYIQDKNEAKQIAECEKNLPRKQHCIKVIIPVGE